MKTPKAAAPRVPLGQPCRVSLPDGSRKTCVIIDIALDGLALAASSPLPPGTQCQVAFDLPGSQSVTIEALVRVIDFTLLADSGFRLDTSILFIRGDGARDLERFIAP